MQPVKYGRTWNITTKAEYDAAMEELDGNDFCAEMSDDYSVTRSEQAEVSHQRAEVIRQAKERGLI